jgi:hypothetical protein
MKVLIAVQDDEKDEAVYEIVSTGSEKVHRANVLVKCFVRVF